LNDTTDGVVRFPSGFAIIFDSVPSRTISLKWWGREQLPSGFHHLFLSLLSQKSPVSVAQATETFTTAGNIFLASLRLASYLSFIV